MSIIRIGTNNIISDATITATDAATAYPVDNIKNATLDRFESNSTSETVSISFNSQSVQMITFHGIIFDNLTINLDLATVLVATQVFTSADKSGIDNKSITFTLANPVTIDNIELVFTGSSVPKIQYCFIGDQIRLEYESLQTFDNSTDEAFNSRGNTTSYNPGYLYTEYQLTTAIKEEYGTYRDKWRIILDEGWAMARPYIIEGDYIPTDIILGQLSSGRIPYNIISTRGQNNQFKVQSTVRIIEVNGEDD
jgi:hypothetical protein